MNFSVRIYKMFEDIVDSIRTFHKPTEKDYYRIYLKNGDIIESSNPKWIYYMLKDTQRYEKRLALKHINSQIDVDMPSNQEWCHLFHINI